ncbi:hypothetical protein MRB53_011610 [Persea americana]|uniref:Uncharacterized protein n=1 Tax=Persea americana TaxID=3435 RepID=A0ACC2LVE7_PERAE|nr:hypothetical protein MRB53_011610 [Persea americana]
MLCWIKVLLKLKLNYEILNKRSRQGMILAVPSGSSDSSSPHHQIPATQRFLKFFISDCDFEEIGAGFFEAILKACQTLYWIFPNPFSQLEHEPGTRAIVSILRILVSAISKSENNNKQIQHGKNDDGGLPELQLAIIPEFRVIALSC